MMKPRNRLHTKPVVFPKEERVVGSRALQTVIYRAVRNRKQTIEQTTTWEGEGGKPAPAPEAARGYGVFVNPRPVS